MTTSAGPGPRSKAGFELPAKTRRDRDRARRVLGALHERYPDAKCALDYRTPYELLVACILSAQSTDVGVNKATPALFAALPDPAA